MKKRFYPSKDDVNEAFDFMSNHVTIYRILPSTTQEETDKFLREKALPSHLEKIGIATISNGTWSFPWKIPNQTFTGNYKYGGFWIAVEADSGIVSGA